MALKTAPEAPAGGAQDFPRLTDYVGRIVVLEPMQEKTIDTKYKDGSQITECIAWWWDEKKKSLEEIGEVGVFWGAVRAQLKEALATNDQVVGRLIQNGRRYELDSVPAAVVSAIAEKLF